jgi:hypothetical protein
MGVGESIFTHLLAQREAKRQYQFDFMPPAASESPHALTLDAGDATVHVVAEDFGTQGILLESLRFVSGRRVSSSADGLVRLVEKIVQVESPYGPIKCIENDENLTRAVLRTDPTGDGKFLEIVVSGGSEAELKHFTVAPTTRDRKQSPVNMGRTVFERLADGLAEAFCFDELVESRRSH